MVSTLKANLMLAELVKRESRNPELERFLEGAFLGRHKLRDAFARWYNPFLRRKNVEYQDPWSRPLLYLPFLDQRPVWATTVPLAQSHSASTAIRSCQGDQQVTPGESSRSNMDAPPSSLSQCPSATGSSSSSTYSADCADTPDWDSAPVNANPVVAVSEVLKRNVDLIRREYHSIDRWYSDWNVRAMHLEPGASWKKVPVKSYCRWHGDNDRNANSESSAQRGGSSDESVGSVPKRKGLADSAPSMAASSLDDDELAITAKTRGTRRLLQQLPWGLLASGLGSVYFSKIEGRAHIKEHYGPTNGRIRLHLGVDIPPTRECSLRIGDGLYHWANDEVLAFDDSYYHGVRLGSDDLRRGILLVDVYHPGLTHAEKVFLEKMEVIKSSCFQQLQDWRMVH